MFSAMFSAILSFPSTTVKNEEVAAIPQIPYPETPTLMVPKKIEKLTMSLEEFGRKYPELVNFLAGVDEDATFDSIIEKIFNTLEGNRAFFNDPKRALEYEKQYRESQGYGTSKTLSGTIQNIGLIIQTLEYIKKTLLQGV